MVRASTCSARAATRSASSMRTRTSRSKRFPLATSRADSRFRLTEHVCFVANTWDDTLSVIDTASLEVVATWPVGAEPSSVVEDRAGKYLFVANRISNDVAVLECADRRGREAARGRAWCELHHAVTGRRSPLRHACLSESFCASDRPRIGDHGDRHGARRGRRSHSAAQHRPRLSYRFLSRRKARRCGYTASQEPCAARAP